MPARPYQIRTVEEVQCKWSNDARHVCVVAPTGAGKTRIGQMLIERERKRCVFLVPRRELLRQTVERLRGVFGSLDVGAIGGGLDSSPYARVQVATIQTLLKREQLPDVDLLIQDECHHNVSREWGALVQRLGAPRSVGLTATPERGDGRPLGDAFCDLVVAANYSDLTKDRFLVGCRVYQPPQIMGSDLANDPLAAYQRHASGGRGFLYCRTVDDALEQARRFREAGIPTETITHKTKKGERDSYIEAFSAGYIHVLTNVDTLTEGVDVPAASVAILARAFQHVTPFLQACGRVLRPANGKDSATVIDLVGATLIHGMPVEDRIYSLDGEGIKRTSVAPLRVCPKCGATVLSAYPACPECGFEFPRDKIKAQKIYSLELREVFAGADTPPHAKQNEFLRLLELCERKGWNPYVAIKEYKKLFGHGPRAEVNGLSTTMQRRVFDKILGPMKQRGESVNQARGIWKQITGNWPDWSWR